VAVQQGRLGATSVGITFSDYYDDIVVSSISDVDRAIHNATEYLRLALQRPQAVDAHSGDTSAPDTLSSAAHYIDGSYIASPTSGVNLVRVGFASGQNVATTSIAVYSTQPIDDNEANWEVATSLDGSDAQFILTNFKATSLSVQEDSVTLDGVPQFKYTITFTAPAIGGLRYWRVKRLTGDGSGDFDDLTEVEIVAPLTPTFTIYPTGGGAGVHRQFGQADILDAAFNDINGIFYTIRFNSGTQGTSTVTLDDDFSDADAGTASGTTGFHTGRWTESTTNTAFLRVSDELSYNSASAKGQLETTYTLNDFTATIDFDPTTLTTEQMWFALRALDADNKVLVQEGVGIETSPTTSGVIFATAVESFVNNTATCTLGDLRPLWHNCASGTETFALTYSGSVWTVTGTQTGALTDAATGVLYDESTDATTPMEFLISCTTSPSEGENFTFNLTTENVKRMPTTATGILSVARTGSDFTTHSVFTSPRTSLSSDAVAIELFGNTDGSVQISADNYIVTGSGTFPSVAVFTVERVDPSDGEVVAGNPTVIEAFDVIGDPSLGYNDFLDGRVQIAATASGGGGGYIYLKVGNELWKYSNAVSILGTEDGSSADVNQVGQIAADGTHSLAWTYSSAVGGVPFLTYVEYEDSVDMIHLKTIDKDTLQNTTDTKEVFLDITGYSTSQEFRVFYHQTDFNTLYYVNSSYALQAFNVDETISAFMAVNADDVTLPAGTAQSTNVNADVINAWGVALDGKTVTFSVTAGDGAITPSSDVTSSGGRASSQFTVGSTVGVSTVTASVTEA
jgi:hypothetical protein